MLHLLAKNSGVGNSGQEELIKSYIRKYFPPEEWDNAWAVLMKENAPLNASEISKTGDYGLFQINKLSKEKILKKKYGYTMDDMLDPEKNIRVAADLFLGRIPLTRRGWVNWNGASRDLKQRQEPDYSQFVPGSQPPPTPTPLVPPQSSAKSGYLQNVSTAFKDLITKDIADPSSGSQPPQSFGEEVKDFLKVLLGQAPRVTQAFGVKNPSVEVFNRQGINTGTDYGVGVGTPVTLPQGNWKVVQAYAGASGRGYIGNKQNTGYGNSVMVQNTDTGEKMRLSHLSEVYVSPGQVLKGGTIAKSGATGNVTGPHLDLEYYDAKGNLGNVDNSSFGRYLGKTPTPQTFKSQPPQSTQATPQSRYAPLATTSFPTPQARAIQAPTSSSVGSSGSSRSGPSAPSYGTSSSYSAPKSVPSPQAAVANASSSYSIRPGDTLSAIAARTGTTVAQLAAANKISNPNVIYAGSKISIPAPAKSSALAKKR